MQVPPLPELAAAGDAARDAPAEAHRLRLVGAMAALLAEKGYSSVTIADIARQARVSKRTFYEHFADKDACFIACYETLSDMVLRAIIDAMSGDQPWMKRVRASTRAYYSAGPRALQVRRQVQRRFADNLRRMVDQGRKENPKLPRLSQAMATAIIGGINELVLVAVEEGRTHRLTELSGTADALLLAVLGS
jgi:AcrR family transcriptional regulator